MVHGAYRNAVSEQKGNAAKAPPPPSFPPLPVSVVEFFPPKSVAPVRRFLDNFLHRYDRLAALLTYIYFDEAKCRSF